MVSFFEGMYCGSLNFMQFGILSENKEGLNENTLITQNKFSSHLKKNKAFSVNLPYLSGGVSCKGMNNIILFRILYICSSA